MIRNNLSKSKMKFLYTLRDEEKESMKRNKTLIHKVFSLVLVVVLVSAQSSFLTAEELAKIENTEKVSFVNDYNEVVTVQTTLDGNSSLAKVYVDGILAQTSVANGETETIDTVLHDIKSSNINEEIPKPEISDVNGFTSTVSHDYISEDSIQVDQPAITPYRLYIEPVENTGLSPAGFGGSNWTNYYYLGYHGNYYYAPNVLGYLYRTYTRTYLGETNSWQWGVNESLGAISAYISLFGGPVGAIVGLLTFGVGLKLAHATALHLATYSFHYTYRVRVNGVVHFTTNRNITYWRIKNVTEKTTKWEQKSFNCGFSMANTEMVKAGKDNYLVNR